MNRNKISHNIKEKLDNWIHGLPETLRAPVQNSVFVSGGCIASMLLGEEVNDYDLYFTDSKVLRNLVEHYVHISNARSTKNSKVSKIAVIDNGGSVDIQIKSAGLATSSNDKEDNPLDDYDYFESQSEAVTTEYMSKIRYNKRTFERRKGYLPLMFTSNAVSLSDDVQIITRFVGSPDQVHKNFDFIHATNTFSYKDGLILRPEAVEAILMKELRYNGSLYPVAAMFRMRKFIQRGWKINVGQMFKIAYDISNLNLNNISVLREQLTGVDVAYFMEVLSKLEKTEDIDRTYLFSVLNEIFEGEE
jgi:hypothetical protein